MLQLETCWKPNAASSGKPQPWLTRQKWLNDEQTGTSGDPRQPARALGKPEVTGSIPVRSIFEKHDLETWLPDRGKSRSFVLVQVPVPCNARAAVASPVRAALPAGSLSFSYARVWVVRVHVLGRGSTESWGLGVRRAGFWGSGSSARRWGRRCGSVSLGLVFVGLVSL
jgi:hypothetical protein